nr:zinc finger SWIM domain-containing protein 7 [Aotus nancymaae]
MAVVLPAVVEELLSEMAAAMQESARTTQALDLVDRQSITLISSPSGSGRLPDGNEKSWLDWPSPALPVSNRCVCFIFQCKHLLAVYLSQVMRTCQQLSVSDKQLTDILLMEKKQEP